VPVRIGLVTLVLATACGLAVANIYFAQPILDLLAGSFHTSQDAATAAVTVVQVGYAVGLVLLPPFAAQLAPEARRGRIVGWVGSGLLLGILLAR
jgi:predicted MFS family arabinose efflux permease